jgi:hypothetical protein
MKHIPTLFLKAVIILIGVGTLAFLLWEPHVEGVNANATTLFEIYFDDPFLAYAYGASILFFIALYQAFILLGYIEKDTLFSHHSVKALRTIKYCEAILAALIAAAVVFLVITMRGKDDIAGGVAMGLFTTFVSVIVATMAAVLERIVHNTVNVQSKNSSLTPSL